MAKDVKKEEKQAEKEAEAQAKVETPAQEAAGPVDEEAQKAAAVEKEAGTAQEVPAEVAAINTDTETAKEATEAAKPAKKEKPAPSGKFKDIIKQIEELKVADLAELVKELEERFGVSAAMMAAPAAPASAEATASQEEKSTYTVVLTDSGAQKIAVIKAVREIKPDLGLKEAKDLVDAPPKELLKDAKKDAADEAKKKIEAAGGKVELK